MFENFTNETLLDDLLFDKWAFTTQRVGRKLMSAQELWQSWLES